VSGPSAIDSSSRLIADLGVHLKHRLLSSITEVTSPWQQDTQ
jgi:hypothetical protein